MCGWRQRGEGGRRGGGDKGKQCVGGEKVEQICEREVDLSSWSGNGHRVGLLSRVDSTFGQKNHALQRRECMCKEMFCCISVLVAFMHFE